MILTGQYKIHELDKVMWSLYKDYGRIVKVGGLIGTYSCFSGISYLNIEQLQDILICSSFSTGRTSVKFSGRRRRCLIVPPCPHYTTTNRN